MEITTGIDLIETARVKKCIRNPRFIERVYGARERRFINFSSPGGALSAAGNFAAKEAFLKAFGVGLSAVRLSEIEVLRLPDGAPHYVLSGRAEKLAAGFCLSVSITHTKDYAAAVAVRTPDTPADDKK